MLICSLVASSCVCICRFCSAESAHSWHAEPLVVDLIFPYFSLSIINQKNYFDNNKVYKYSSTLMRFLYVANFHRISQLSSNALNAIHVFYFTLN